jgi:membrane protein insertase Oxa1/YidC/SpoIIIJ
VVSILTLPLYFMAERHQAAECAIQKAMLPEIQNIKAVFKGDERYLMLAAWYRQNHYHPVYALRSSLGVAIQIPFFIAAFHFIANLEPLKNISLRGRKFLAGRRPIRRFNAEKVYMR